MTPIEYADYRHYIRAFETHRRNARRRSIAFDLTFEQWLYIWLESGHLKERGVKRSNYVMSRIRDEGGYSWGNVEIIRTEENLRQEQVVKKRSEAMKRYHASASSVRYTHLRRGNNPKSRVVVDPYGIDFPSAAAAAEVHGITRQAVAKNCRDGRRGWRYLDGQANAA